MERVENMYSWKSSHGWKVDGLIGGPIDKKREQKGMTPRFDRLERAVTRFDKGRVNGAILIKILCPREILILKNCNWNLDWNCYKLLSVTSFP